MSKEAKKLALETLEAIAIHGDLACVVTPDGVFYLQPAITALREALAEQPAQKCSYPYCGCNSKAWCKVERNEALDKMAENARELGLDYEPVSKDNSNYRYDPPVAEPVAWKWHQAPVKTSWGQEMVVADLAIDKDNTVSVYCERDQTAKVEAMLALPAQPAPVQEPVACVIDGDLYFHHEIDWEDLAYQGHGVELLYTTPPAQRQWVGLTDEDIIKCTPTWGGTVEDVARAIEAKLMEKNT
jgi:hypothetical protein